MELVILVGLQASGKSTFVRKRLAATHRVLSKDAFPNARRPQARLMRLLTEALTEGVDVVVDNTNPSIEDRHVLIAEGRRFGAAIVGYYFRSTVKDCRTRNARRTGKACVPDVALYSTAAKLTVPTIDEGFDALHYVRLRGRGFVVETWRED